MQKRKRERKMGCDVFKSIIDSFMQDMDNACISLWVQTLAEKVANNLKSTHPNESLKIAKSDLNNHLVPTVVDFFLTFLSKQNQTDTDTTFLIK